MKIVLLVLAYLLIPFAAKVLLDRCLNSYKSQDGLVCYRPYVLIIGVVDTVTFLAIATAATIEKQLSWFVVAGCLLFVALGVFAIVCYGNCRIWFDESTFTVSGFLGKKHTFTYKDITGICDDGYAEYTLYCGEKRVNVAHIAGGSREFRVMAQAQYVRCHGGRDIPTISCKKSDIFNGNLRNPWEYIATGVLLSLAVAGLINGSLAVGLRTENETTAPPRDCMFTDYILSENTVEFHTATGELYKVTHLPEGYPKGKWKALCETEMPLVVYARYITPENAESYYSVKQIKYGEEIILSFDETRWFRWESDGRAMVIAASSVAGILLVMMALFIVVARHPQKFPRKLVNVVIRKGDLIE